MLGNTGIRLRSFSGLLPTVLTNKAKSTLPRVLPEPPSIASFAGSTLYETLHERPLRPARSEQVRRLDGHHCFNNGESDQLSMQRTRDPGVVPPNATIK